MKKLVPAIILFLFSLQLHAQIVNIPDAEFKQDLLEIYPSIDLNANGEIEVSEALAVTELNISSTTITDLTGLEAFQNLTKIEFYGMQINDLNVNSLTNLTELWVSESNVQNFNINNLTNLKRLILSGVPLSNLNVSNLTSLEILIVNSCSLTQLDASNLSQLVTLNCSLNAITSVTLPTNNTIRNFNCSDNQLSSIDLSSFTNLKWLRCSSNPFNALTIANNSTVEEIICTDLGLTTIGFQNLPSIKKIDCSNTQMNTVDLSQIPSLQELTITNTLLTNINLNNLPNLTKLDCGNNTFSGLNLALVPQLKELYCHNTAISSLDFSVVPQLEKLGCTNTLMTSIDFNGLTSLTHLSFGNALLAQVLNLSSLTSVTNFGMSQTTLQSIDLSPMTAMTTLMIVNTPLQTLDFSNNVNVRFIYITYNSNLEYMNANNGRPIVGLSTGSSYVKYCPLLTKVCTDQRNVSTMRTCLTRPDNFNSATDPLVLPYCNFAPNGEHNTVSGTLSFDADGNGCDSNDPLVSNSKIKLVYGSTQYETLTVFGNYIFYPAPGNYVLSPNLENNYFNISPPSTSFSFADYNNNTITQNFCLSPNGIKNDLSIQILPYRNATAGFPAGYFLVFKNNGNQTLSGNINLSFDDSRMDYSIGLMQPSSITPNNLMWNFTNLAPFETRRIYFEMNLNDPTDATPLNIGDILDFTATISPLGGDETPDDNEFHLAQTVVNSYDPNDKICLEGATISPEKVGDYLHYMIRFQNMGTAPAQNIVVKDVLDTTKLDMNSFQLIDSSHEPLTRITNNTVEFIYENINLATETADEPNSHGYVAFKIKTKPTLVVGNVIENKAEIYFDFNFPIITNTASTTVSLLNIAEITDNSVSISPIPVKSLLGITAKETITSVELYDIQGWLLHTKTTNSTQTDLDFSGKTAGIYLVRIYTEKGFKVQKVIKE